MGMNPSKGCSIAFRLSPFEQAPRVDRPDPPQGRSPSGPAPRHGRRWGCRRGAPAHRPPAAADTPPPAPSPRQPAPRWDGACLHQRPPAPWKGRSGGSGATRKPCASNHCWKQGSSPWRFRAHCAAGGPATPGAPQGGPAKGVASAPQTVPGGGSEAERKRAVS